MMIDSRSQSGGVSLRRRIKLALLFVAAYALVGIRVHAATGTAADYVHEDFGHHFVAASPKQIAVLDPGTQIRGWTRTGYAFPVATASPTAVPSSYFVEILVPAGYETHFAPCP